MTTPPVTSADSLATLLAAITPDHHSRSAYVGRVQQTETVTVFAEDGTATEKEVSFWITWDSISQILGLIQKRAGVESS